MAEGPLNFLVEAPPQIDRHLRAITLLNTSVVVVFVLCLSFISVHILLMPFIHRKRMRVSDERAIFYIFVVFLCSSCCFIKTADSLGVPPVSTTTTTTRCSRSARTRLSHVTPSLQARRRRYDDDDYYDEDDEDDFFNDNRQSSSRRRRSPSIVDNLGEVDAGRQDGGFNLPSSFGRRSGWRLPESVSKALLAGVFILGVGLGVTVDSAINTNPRDLASRDAVDQAAPNPNLCATYGASAMAFDQRVFVSFNPFNVYVAQADVKPACVLRPANVVSVLKDRKLINDAEVRACKQNMNTWAFVGDLGDMPQLSCVYKSADAQNEFLSNPKYGIGEDVYDDDRAQMMESTMKQSSGKIVKGTMTEAQKELIRSQAGLN
jgi:hypothetical protein